ncbi:MAG: radical SAM protein [Deltaproteobacteria bacterium HGW-Deltaproteobacteria-2]|jgi:MoaA/NifB/PqqE/SkfB family radical SAM enzyme|nr:MAG: radical SAM protein [Deltaproteobacteria bacterium HGW-Deltaproteobacteria-2]
MNVKRKANNKGQPLKDPLRRFSLFSTKPPLSKLYIEPTTQCNLQCRTCIRNSWDEPIGSMDMTIYRKLLSDLKDFKTLNTIAFWGYGEPLAHPEIVNMVAESHEIGLKTEVITNGHLIDKDTAKGFIQAGLDTLVVSVDGTNQASYEDVRIGGDLSRVEENIRGLNLLRAKMSGKKLDLGLEFVIMKSNIHQLPDLAHKAHSMKADFIMLTNLLPCTEDMKDEILYWISATINENEERPKWSQELMLPRMDFRTEYLTPLMEFLKRLDRPMPEIRDIPQEYCCPFVQRGSAAITWSGDVSPCIALMHSYRCYILGREKFIKRYSVGNIAQEKIGDIWNKNNYQNFRDRVLTFDFSPCVQCSGCSYSETNEEDCFGNAHPVCGDCLWARSVLLCP